MDKMEFLTLDMLKKGDVWLVITPRRLIKVGARGIVSAMMPQDDGNKVLKQFPAINLWAVVPDIAIEGFVDEPEARKGRMIAGGLIKTLRDDKLVPGYQQFDEYGQGRYPRVWQEVVFEKNVNPLKRHPKSVAMILDEERLVPRLFVGEYTGRAPGSLNAYQAMIEGVKIPKELVPKDLWKGQEPVMLDMPETPVTK